jgi:hypothetical protein
MFTSTHGRPVGGDPLNPLRAARRTNHRWRDFRVSVSHSHIALDTMTSIPVYADRRFDFGLCPQSWSVSVDAGLGMSGIEATESDRAGRDRGAGADGGGHAP